MWVAPDEGAARMGRAGRRDDRGVVTKMVTPQSIPESQLAAPRPGSRQRVGEAGEELLDQPPAAREQTVGVASPRDSLAGSRFRALSITLDGRHLPVLLGQDMDGEHPGHTAAGNDGVRVGVHTHALIM